MQNRHSIATTKYNREKTVLLTVRLNKKTDAKLIEQINKHATNQPKSAYIKKLVADDAVREEMQSVASHMLIGRK